jgi:hypothetical protein
MKNIEKIKNITALIVFAVIITAALVISALPGTEEDPLISKSYVDAMIVELSEDFDARINALIENLDSGREDELVEVMANKIIDLNREINELSARVDEQNTYAKFIVIEIEEGQKVIFKDSSEFILRGGKVEAISGEKGDGLADITTDKTENTYYTGDSIPINHLILASRDDGRGITALTKAWVLVKGPYEILPAE